MTCRNDRGRSADRAGRCARSARSGTGRRRFAGWSASWAQPHSCAYLLEAGPAATSVGQLTELGAVCAWSRRPLTVRAGDRVKLTGATQRSWRAATQRRLDAVWVRDAAHEALRDLVPRPRGGEEGPAARPPSLQKFCCGATAAAGEDQKRDCPASRLGEDAAARTARAGGHAARYIPRSACPRAHRRLERAIDQPSRQRRRPSAPSRVGGWRASRLPPSCRARAAQPLPQAEAADG